MTNPYAPPTADVEDIPVPVGHLEQASRASRLGAAILDTLVFGALFYVPLLIGLGMMGISGSLSNPQSLESAPEVVLWPIAFAVLGLIIWAAVSIKYVLANGQSIGKKIVGIKVVRADGTAASFPRILFLRNGINTLIGFIPFVGIAYGIVDTLFIFREDERCIHDRLADTIVVQA